MAGFICVCICNVIVAIFIHAGKVVSSPSAFIYMVVFRLLNGRAWQAVDRSFQILTKAASAAFCCRNYLFLPHIPNILGSNLVALMNKVLWNQSTASLRRS